MNSQQELQSFQDTLRTLQSRSRSQLCHEEFMNSNLYLVTESTKVTTERFGKLRDIINPKLPVLLCSKSSLFWQVIDNSRIENEASFVSVRKRNKGKSKCSSSSSEKSTLGGSPLKLDVIADLSVFDGDVSVPAYTGRQKHIDCGLALGKARQIVSLYARMFSSQFKGTSVSDKNMNDPTLIIPCDVKHIKSVSCLCLEPLLDKQNNFKGVMITETISKPLADKSAHMKLQTNFSASSVACQAKYDLMSSGSDKCNIDIQNMIKLELAWKKNINKSVVLLHAPPSDAKSVVKVQVTSGNTNSPAFSVYQELEILRSIISGLATMEVNWIGTQDTPLVDSIKDLIEQLKLGSDTVEYKKADTSSDEDIQVGFHSVMLEERKDLDFTDHLWKIFQNCTSYSELVEAFSYIVSVLRKGELQPLIHRHNKTAVAQMVRDSFQGQLRSPNLTGLQPLLYLAEMGMQKLTQDYIHTYLSKNLTTLPQLGYFVNSHNLDLEDGLVRLTKLQNILETVIMLKQFVNVPLGPLAESARCMLKHYETHEVDASHQFTFPVPTSCLVNVLEGFAPCEWRAEGSRIVGGFAERLVYHLTTEQPFDWVSIEGERASKGSAGEGEETAYYLTLVKDSVSILT